MNLGSPRELSVLELAETVRDLVGAIDLPIRFVPRPVDDPGVRRSDVTLAREVLGWEPVTSLHDGLKNTFAWFRGRVAVDN